MSTRKKGEGGSGDGQGKLTREGQNDLGCWPNLIPKS